MTCARVRRRLSTWIDGELGQQAAAETNAHLSACPDCRRRAAELAAASRAVSELPRIEPPESVAARVRDRLDLEARNPALAVVLRRFGAARPYMLPSIVPAALVVVALLAGALALDSGPLPPVHFPSGAWGLVPPSGTEGNPLLPSAEILLPREAGPHLPAEALVGTGEGTLFLETIVARDGTVADVRLLGGDVALESALLDALRRQRFVPAHYRGRPVAVSVYRLISRMEVRSPLT
jgi:Putative zinc-finger/Gram-negative bacterial TonB protein C-terminal